MTFELGRGIEFLLEMSHVLQFSQPGGARDEPVDDGPATS